MESVEQRRFWRVEIIRLAGSKARSTEQDHAVSCIAALKSSDLPDQKQDSTGQGIGAVDISMLKSSDLPDQKQDFDMSRAVGLTPMVEIIRLAGSKARRVQEQRLRRIDRS